jgi:hypothetical protein
MFLFFSISSVFKASFDMLFVGFLDVWGVEINEKLLSNKKSPQMSIANPIVHCNIGL